MTALHFFAKLPWNTHLSERVLQLLLLTCSPFLVNTKGEAALHVAAVSGNIPCVEKMIASGADVNITTSTGDTPIMYALRARKETLVRRLLDFQPNLAIVGMVGTAQEIAQKMNLTQLVPLLDPNRPLPQTSFNPLPGPATATAPRARAETQFSEVNPSHSQ